MTKQVTADELANNHRKHEELVHEESIELDETDMARIRNLAASLHTLKEISEAVKQVIHSKHFIEPWNVNYCTIELEKKAEQVALRIALETGRPSLQSSSSYTEDLPEHIRQAVEASDSMDLANSTGCVQCGDHHH